MIRERTGLPAVVENDVRALTAAEHWFGAAAGCSDFVLVTIGVGVGCGIVVDDRLVDGANGGSGQIGHLPVTAWGALCERGHRGCVAVLPVLDVDRRRGVRRARPAGRATTRCCRWPGTVRRLPARVVEEAGHALGTLIGTIATMTAPAKVIVSGEGVALAAMVLDITRERARDVQHWTLPDVPIEIAPFTFTEWARGAAVIALRNQLDVAVRPDA